MKELEDKKLRKILTKEGKDNGLKNRKKRFKKLEYCLRLSNISITGGEKGIKKNHVEITGRI